MSDPTLADAIREAQSAADALIADRNKLAVLLAEAAKSLEACSGLLRLVGTTWTDESDAHKIAHKEADHADAIIGLIKEGSVWRPISEFNKKEMQFVLVNHGGLPGGEVRLLLWNPYSRGWENAPESVDEPTFWMPIP
jgi:hypothetical protein